MEIVMRCPLARFVELLRQKYAGEDVQVIEDESEEEPANEGLQAQSQQSPVGGKDFSETSFSEP
jgi:hypothetical protein